MGGGPEMRKSISASLYRGGNPRGKADLNLRKNKNMWSDYIEEAR